MPFFGSLIHPNSKSSQSQKNMQNHLNGHRKKQNHKKRGKRESRTVGLLGWTAREISTVCFFLQIVTLSEREERRRRRKKKNTLFGGGVKWRSFSSDGWKERRYWREVTSGGRCGAHVMTYLLDAYYHDYDYYLLLWEIKAEQRCSRPGEELKDLKLKEGIWFFFFVVTFIFIILINIFLRKRKRKRKSRRRGLHFFVVSSIWIVRARGPRFDALVWTTPVDFLDFPFAIIVRLKSTNLLFFTIVFAYSIPIIV